MTKWSTDPKDSASFKDHRTTLQLACNGLEDIAMVNQVADGNTCDEKKNSSLIEFNE